MIVLDTNVLSEVLRPSPSKQVLDWLEGQEADTVYITAITQAEMLYGIEVLPQGRRKRHLAAALAQIFSEEFRGRVLPFDEECPAPFAKIVAMRRASGHPISQSDAMIAAIARSRGAVVATRNSIDFVDCGLRLVNPWEEEKRAS